ncbi:helix-turn-helix domain-containing protein [Streptomyces sp. NPDC093065]|uniref:helix-turn-helix domain-containing protein n=1 Tax=Streptomyces sp. NPDC093065 TaxID=3366021 RepID=UPI00382779A4
MRHLTLRRLQKARRQLAETSVPLQEIARFIGCGSHVGCHLAFRKEYAMTPGEYRNRTAPAPVPVTT